MGAARIYNRGEAVVGDKIKVKGEDVWVNAAIPSGPDTRDWTREFETNEHRTAK